jgi:ABC-2 type transport system permease protein
VGITDYLLQVTAFMFAVSIGTITLLTMAIAGLALGFGTMFPQFDTENAAQIPTSFGGLVFMMTSVALIGAVVILEARPVYSYLNAAMNGGAPDAVELYTGFALSLALCTAGTLVPIHVAIRRLEAVER